MKNILVFVAHSDDEFIGIGGTLLKYSDKYNLIKVVFSAGEKTLILGSHLNESYIINERIKETERISKKAKIKKNIYLHLIDGKLQNFKNDEGILNQIRDIILKYKPQKIFTLTSVDTHPDHRAVNEITLNALKLSKHECSVYGYEVWNLSKVNEPIVYEDITKFMKKKIQLMREFKSQWIYIYTLLIPTYVRAIKNGRKIGKKYAERFFKLQ
jgi:LmbE family N-acetylglucosaminyl deacetylase